MAMLNIRKGTSTGANPAVNLLDQMQVPTRSWAFDVEFIVNGIDSDTKKFHYFARKIDKPKYEFKFAEINRYGFRHKILTGIQHGDLGIEFIDDSTSRVLNFIDHYLRHSVNDKNHRYTHDKWVPIMTANGFDYAGIKPSGSVKPNGTIIQQIKIHQYAGIGEDGTGRNRMRTWTFDQPQITNFDLDSHDSEDDNLSGFVVNFNFKNVLIEVNTGNNYPDRSDDPIGALVDLESAAFNKLETQAQGSDRSKQSQIEREGFGGTVIDQPNKDTDSLIREGAANTQKADTILQDPRRSVTNQINRNDYVNSTIGFSNSIPESGSIVREAPTIENQDSKLLKLFG